MIHAMFAAFAGMLLILMGVLTYKLATGAELVTDSKPRTFIVECK